MSDQEPSNLEKLRHSLAHLMAAAVMDLYPNAKRTIGPATDTGFYFDFDFGDDKVGEDELPAIESKMLDILKDWQKNQVAFVEEELSADEAKAEYAGNEYKAELIDGIAEKDEKITFYRSGDYTDLCRGGHVETVSQIKSDAFKLDRVAGAYWRGDEKNTMLTRIYGLAFENKKDLKTYLAQQEEAKKRDHRKIGKEMELYFIDDMVGKGLVMWLPNGTIVRDQLENYAKEVEHKAGYKRVSTPHIAKEDLFLTSGHLPYYKEDMYPAMEMDDGTYYLKAMNCPHHHRIFQNSPKSYRDLPLRLAEYGMCYRNELSGTLAGLLRVRGLAMNDAHIYCTKEQVKDEIKAVLDMTRSYFDTFGLDDYWFRLSKWDPNRTEKYFDEPASWEYTQDMIREVLVEMELPFTEADDEAAFYGPKIDAQFKSVIGREETMSTIQLDFAAKERFGLSYVDNTGAENKDVFVIHRAPLSVHERFMAFLIEHYAGQFPTWLAPDQVRVISIGDDHRDYATAVEKQLHEAGIRSSVDNSNEGLGKKIKSLRQYRIPYWIVVGDNEVANNTVTLESRNGDTKGEMNLEDFLEKLLKEISDKSD